MSASAHQRVWYGGISCVKELRMQENQLSEIFPNHQEEEKEERLSWKERETEKERTLNNAENGNDWSTENCRKMKRRIWFNNVVYIMKKKIMNIFEILKYFVLSQLQILNVDWIWNIK